jgi:hypothetical protein
MNMHHTLGPWRLEGSEIVSGYGDARTAIAYVIGGNGMAYEEDAANTECAANARLIAAAPDMLQAMQFILSDAAMTVADAREVAREAIKLAAQQVGPAGGYYAKHVT